MQAPVCSAKHRGVGTIAAGLAALACGHLAVDCCTGIWPVYKTIAHLDLATAGLIATAGSMIANGLQVVFGIIADRGFAKRLLVGGAVLAGFVTLVPLTHSYPLLFALVLITSVGSAAFHPVGTGAAGALSRERTGIMVSLFLIGGYVGYAFSQLVFTALYRAAGGATVVLWALPLLAALAIVRFVEPAPPRPVASAAVLTRSRRAAAPRLAVLFAVQVFTTAISTSLIFLLPDLLESRHAPSWAVEGGGHFAMVMGSAAALIPAGLAADRFGARRVLLVLNLVTGVLLWLALYVGDTVTVLLPLVAAFGAFNSANNVVVVSEGNRMMPGQNSGVSALLMGAPWVFAAAAPAIAGVLADPAHGGTPSAALGWLAFCIPLALTASLLLPRRRESVD